jgi:hypothetical protein
MIQAVDKVQSGMLFDLNQPASAIESLAVPV